MSGREGARVLVVDDKRGSREALRKMIAKEGFEVEMAHDAETAAGMFGARPANLVITDLRMPGMDGIGLLKRVKRESPETEVILISGAGSIESAVEAMREGAYDFLTKPLERVVVLKAMDKALEKQALLRENADLRARLRRLHAQRVRVRRVFAGADIGEASMPWARRWAANSSTKPWTVSTFCAPERTTMRTSSGKSQWSLSGNE